MQMALLRRWGTRTVRQPWGAGGAPGGRHRAHSRWISWRANPPNVGCLRARAPPPTSIRCNWRARVATRIAVRSLPRASPT